MRSLKRSLILATAIASAVNAQVTTPQNNGGGGGTASADAPSSNAQQPALGEDLPFFNPSTELITWNGQTFAATDNRIFTARFEKFLSTPPDESEAAAAYRKTLQEIQDFLSPSKTGGSKLASALALLPEAAAYPGDSRICDSLTQAIYVAIQSRKDVGLTKDLQEALRMERKKLVRNHQIVMDSRTRVGSDADGNPVFDKAAELAEITRRLAEIEALLKGQQTKSEFRTIQAKTEYQAMLVQLFLQRRFQHVVIASRFYAEIWKDGDTTMNFEKGSRSERFFSEGAGFSPTVTTLEALANETINDVRRGVASFKYLADRDELSAATTNLTAVYIAGEFLPDVTTLSYDYKRKVQLFARQQIQLVNALEAKDFARASELLSQLEAETNDFDGSKARSVIVGSTRASDLHVRSAKLALQKGETDKAAEEIAKATEFWPQNPKVSEFDQMLDQGTNVVAALNDYDRLYSQGQYREIVRRRFELGAALNDDPTRRAAFEEVLRDIQEIELAVATAQNLERNGQANAAWEALYDLHNKFPKDPDLSSEIVRLSSKVGPFSSALDKARQLESRSAPQTASALAWYLKAKELHPGSELAREGIERSMSAAMK